MSATRFLLAPLLRSRSRFSLSRPTAWLVLALLVSGPALDVHAQTSNAAVERSRTLLCDAEIDRGFRHTLLDRYRGGDQRGAREVLSRVAEMRPACALVRMLRDDLARGLDPGLVLELSAEGIASLERARAPSDATSDLSHGLGIAALVLGAGAYVASFEGALMPTCDDPWTPCDPTPRTALLASGVFGGALAVALAIAAIFLRVDVGAQRHRWAVEGFSL